MTRASPVELRKEISAAQALVKAGILFVPMPVLDEPDHAALRKKSISRMSRIIEMTEQEVSRDSK